MLLIYVGHGLKAVVPVDAQSDIEFPTGEPVEAPEGLEWLFQRLAKNPNFVVAETRGKASRAPARETREK